MTILSFFVASIYSIVMMIVKKIKKEKMQEFIPFGPFIVIASFIVMFVPLNVLIKIPFYVFSFGRIS